MVVGLHRGCLHLVPRLIANNSVIGQIDYIDQNILRLKVSVREALRVNVMDALQHL